MNFERGKDPKEAMGVGLSNDLIHPEKIVVKFRIDKNDDVDLKPIDSHYYTEFLQMWQTGNFRAKRLIKMLHLRGFWRALTLVRVVGVNVKVNFAKEDGTFDFAGNILETSIGEGKHIYISWRGKIYDIPVKEYSRSWII